MSKDEVVGWAVHPLCGEVGDALHVYPVVEGLRHVVDGYPSHLCWCLYRVEIVNGSPLVLHTGEIIDRTLVPAGHDR